MTCNGTSGGTINGVADGSDYVYSITAAGASDTVTSIWHITHTYQTQNSSKKLGYQVNKEIDVIIQDNIDSEGYQLLYSSLESKTSDTLKTLEAELAAINFIQEPEAYAAKEAEINEKERLSEDRAEIKDQLHELEYNNTEDLIAEKTH